MAIFFENISVEIRKTLRSAKNKILICVAWIDFDIYYQDLIDAMNRGVKVRIIVTESAKIKKNYFYIDELQKNGAIFEVIVLDKIINCMHNKIAIIDDKIVISGSYNWTHNAENNYENVDIEIKNQEYIMSCNYEIDRISKMNVLGIKELTKKERCPYCKDKMMNMLVYDEYGQGNLVKVCSGDTGHYINTGETIGGRLPTIINAIYDEEELFELTDFNELNDIISKEYKIKRMEAIDDYILSLGVPIHAVGVVTISTDYYFVGEKKIEMIWFNKSFTAKFENEYYDSFDVF